jgi:glutamate-1-semialdehyde 2,1-aminomutase
MAAGLAMLGQLNAKSYERLEAMGGRLEAGLNAAIAKTGIAACVQRVGSAFTLFFCAGPIADFAAAKQANPKVYADFFHGMLGRGFYLPPAQLEAAFVSLAHTDAEIDSFIAAAQETLATMQVLR